MINSCEEMQERIINSLLNVSKKEVIEEITQLLGSIMDPQKDQTLKSLNVIGDRSVQLQIYPKPGLKSNKNKQSQDTIKDRELNTYNFIIVIRIKPTVPHCHLTQQIGLSIQLKLKQQLPAQWLKMMKIRLLCQPNSHNNQQQIEKQINDKQRIAAAFENEDVLKFIKKLTNNYY